MIHDVTLMRMFTRQRVGRGAIGHPFAAGGGFAPLARGLQLDNDEDDEEDDDDVNQMN